MSWSLFRINSLFRPLSVVLLAIWSTHTRIDVFIIKFSWPFRSWRIRFQSLCHQRESADVPYFHRVSTALISPTLSVIWKQSARNTSTRTLSACMHTHKGVSAQFFCNTVPIFDHCLHAWKSCASALYKPLRFFCTKKCWVSTKNMKMCFGFPTSVYWLSARQFWRILCTYSRQSCSHTAQNVLSGIQLNIL